MAFQPATRKRVKARLAIGAMSKCGKSLTALAMLRGIVGPEGRIAAIDTENGALSLYAGRFPTKAQPSGFDVQDLTHCSPDAYVKAIDEAARAKYDGLLIDSTSQEWQAVLELVDGNTDKFFGGWKAATPKHNAFIRAIVAAPMHVIVTIRQKDDYVIEKHGERNVPVKVGMEMVQRKQFEFEFNAVMTMDLEHNMRVTHSAIDFMPNGTVVPAFSSMDEGIALGNNIRRWLDDGDEDWVPPVFRKAFYVNDREYVSAGIERDTFIKITNLGAAYEKVAKRGAGKELVKKVSGKGVLADLTETEGAAVVEALQEALNAAQQ